MIVTIGHKHVKGAKKTTTGNPVARAIREATGYTDIMFDGSDMMQYRPRHDADWVLTVAPDPARNWLGRWYEKNVIKVPFTFFFPAEVKLHPVIGLEDK